MKVAVYLRDEFEDEVRNRLAQSIDGDLETKRLANRDEIKSFFGLHGEAWRGVLDELITPPEGDAAADLDDLLGEAPADDLEDLI